MYIVYISAWRNELEICYKFTLFLQFSQVDFVSCFWSILPFILFLFFVLNYGLECDSISFDYITVASCRVLHFFSRRIIYLFVCRKCVSIRQFNKHLTQTKFNFKDVKTIHEQTPYIPLVISQFFPPLFISIVTMQFMYIVQKSTEIMSIF